MGQQASLATRRLRGSRHWTKEDASSIENCPMEILLIILDMLDREGLELASLLNRNFNRFVNRRLWATVTISDNGVCSRKRRIRNRIVQICKAITGDVDRASHIKTLNIRLAYPYRLARRPFTFLLRRPAHYLMRALSVVPNLTALRISCFTRHPVIFAEILCEPLPFRLTEFSCMHTLHPLIEPFLRAQSNITDYSIDEAWYRVPIPDTLVYDFESAQRCVPALRRLKTPAQYIGHMLHGRSVHTLDIVGSTLDEDIKDLYKGFYLHTQSRREEALQCRENRISVCNLALNLWLDEDNIHHFPFVLSVSYKISLSSIRSLKLHGWSAPNEESFARNLKLFPNLEYFQWCNPECTTNVGQTYITQLILSCVRNAKKLRRITFTLSASYDYAVGHFRIWSRVPAHSIPAEEPMESVPPTPSSLVPSGNAAYSIAGASVSSLQSRSESFLGVMEKMPPIRENDEWAWVMETGYCRDFEGFSTRWEIEA